MSNSMVAGSWHVYFFQFHFFFFYFCFVFLFFYFLILFYFKLFFLKAFFFFHPFFSFHFVSSPETKPNQNHITRSWYNTWNKSWWPKAHIGIRSSMLDIKRYKKLRYFTCSTWKTMNQVLLFIKKRGTMLASFSYS